MRCFLLNEFVVCGALVYLGSLFLSGAASAATVVSMVVVDELNDFDSSGNALDEGPVTDGLEIYDSMGNLRGTWSVEAGVNFSASQDQNNRNETSSISYTERDRTNTSGADNHSSTFSSYNAGADSAGFVVINNEKLTMSVTWEFRDTRWQRRDMEDDQQSYNLAWSINSFESVAADLGVATGELLTKEGEGVIFGFSDYVDNGGGGSQIVPTDFPVGVDIPSAALSYTGEETDGQLTGKYDGSDFNLTLDTTQTRTVNGTTFDSTMNGNMNMVVGENPRAQLRAFFDADYDYELTYTRYTFIPVPEPSSLLLLCFGSCLFLRRKR